MSDKRKRFCRDCGSPAEGNPCWYFLHREDYGWGDPPCFGREYERDQSARDRRRGLAIVIAFLAPVAFSFLLFLWTR